jgi:NAD(P)-dependent dehydrogenase (short-subunit alcohol dehydrogenase family)
VLAILFILYTYCTNVEFDVHTSGIVIITGAGSGLGKHSAEHLSQRGFTVFAGVRKQTDFDTIAAKNDPNLQPLLLDVSKHASCVAAIDTVKKEMRRLDMKLVGVVNNAGVGRLSPAEFHDMGDARAMFDTNFFGIMDLTQLTLPLLRESRGRIVMISSLAGLIGNIKNAVYSASKFAVEGFSDSLRREVAHFGISVSVIEPAFVKSPIHHKENTIKAYSDPSDSAEEAVAALYPDLYSEEFIAKRISGGLRGDDPIVTSEAIEHALTARRPATRYTVGNYNGTPATLIAYLVRCVSDRMADFLFNMF